MGCTASSMLSRRGCSDDEHDVVIKIGTAVIHDSIHTMIERDRRRKAAQSTTTATESNEYCPRAPHPLLTSRHAAAVVVTATEDDTIVILEDDLSSGNSINSHNEDEVYRNTALILPDITM
jgi:hypothetical protein